MGIKCFQSTSDVVKSYIIYLIGNLLSNSALLGLYNVQSSVNVEDGLGTIALAVYASVGIVVTIFVVPILKHLISPKTGTAIAFLAELIYVALNFYPSYSTLIPANMINGFGRSLFWVYSGIFSVYYAKQFIRFENGSFFYYFKIANGCIFCAILSGQIFGNLVPFIVFEIGLSNNSPLNDSNSNSTSTNPTTATQSMLRFSVSDHCGAKDCQDPSITAANLSNYQPPSQMSYYIVIGIFVAMSFLGTLIHCVFVPTGREIPIERVDKKSSAAYKNEAFSEENKEIFHSNKDVNFNSNNNENNNNIVNSSALKKEDPEKIDNVKEQNSDRASVNSAVIPEGKKQKKIFKIWFEEIKDILKFFFTFHQILMLSIAFYTGFQVGFVISEITRAYVSCVYGVAEVGRSMMFYGVAALIFSPLIGKASGKFGSKPVVGVVFLINCSFYFFCLFWIPDENSALPIVYGLLFVSGISDSTMQAISAEIMVLHFPQSTEKAYIAWTVWMNLGLTVQYAWSTSLCVNYKIYAMLGTLLLGMATYGIAELQYMRKQPLRDECNDEKITKL